MPALGVNVYGPVPLTPVPVHVPPGSTAFRFTAGSVAQKGPAGVIVAFNDGFTVTVAVVVPTHEAALVPVIVYVIVDGGVETTLEPVVALNPVAGDQA